MFVLKTLIICATWLAVQGQGHNGPTTTPVPILKQVNKQNDDGSYSYGYEAADGSFKIETKYPNGDVAGKYGYVDEGGKLREISYGASSERGFEPQGSGIVVPPPTLHEPSNALTDGQEDDGQYREDPKIYENQKYNGRQAAKQPAQEFRQFHRPSKPAEPEPEYQEYQSSFQSSFQPAQTQPQRYQPQNYHSQPIQQYQPQPVQQYQPQPSPLRSASQYSQQTSLFNQAPQQFPQEQRPQSQVYHQQPQFSYETYTPQPYSQGQNYQNLNQNHQNQNYQAQNYQPQNYQPQNYQAQNYQAQNYQDQNYNSFSGHPAQNIDPNTGSYTINYTG